MKHRLILVCSAACAVIIGGWIFLAHGSQAGSDPRVRAVAVNAPAPSETIAVGAATRAPAIAHGFLGLSLEYQSVPADAGPATDPDPLLDELIGNLNPGQRPVIRIGGDSTDHTWWPVAGHTSKGLTYALTPSWLASVAKLADSTDAQLILGIDLEMNRPKLAAAEARALLNGIGADHILQWEVGNEPNLYASFPWYETVRDGAPSGVYTRLRSYSFSNYLKDFNASSASLPDLPLAGPALGSPRWMASVEAMLKDDPDVEDVTYHAYPLNCFAAPGSAAYPSIANLMSAAASDGLADHIAPFAATARAAGRQFRVDELNTVACGGTSGVSDTFASALWMTDTLFAMASKGVSGVNVQDFNASRYKPFSFEQDNGTWVADVAPVYYGMLLFSRAAPAGSKLLAISTRGSRSVRAWAAQTPPQPSVKRAETVTLINTDLTHTRTVRVSAPGTSGATFVRMLAASGARAKDGITLGGLGYPDQTTSANPQGSPAVGSVSPGVGDIYEVSLAPASAVLMTLDL